MEPETRFRELFESTFPVLKRYARHRGLSGQDVDDVVAATYEVAWRRLEDVPAGEAAVPWLLTVALNHLRNRRRKLHRDRRLLERLVEPDQLRVQEPNAADHDWSDIRRALDRLPRVDRELVLLVAWDELSPSEAATVLGLTPGAARTRLHRARARLEAHLRPRGGIARPTESSEAPPPAAVWRQSR